jgi:hypothetical protein
MKLKYKINQENDKKTKTKTNNNYKNDDRI